FNFSIYPPWVFKANPINNLFFRYFLQHRILFNSKIRNKIKYLILFSNKVVNKKIMPQYCSYFDSRIESKTIHLNLLQIRYVIQFSILTFKKAIRHNILKK